MTMVSKSKTIMKRIFSAIILGVSLIAFGAPFTGCTKEMVDINDEVALGRCLTPTELSAKVIDGEFIEFSWTKSKGATEFVLELYSDEEMMQKVETFTIPAADVPYKADLEADMTYYARVKGVNGDGVIEDSNWATFDRALQTYAIKSSLNPELVDRSASSITIKWTKDPEVDHIRITPALNAGEDYTRFEVSADAQAAAQVEVTGLKPSVKYTLAVHFKSAERGNVIAWTHPDTENAVRVSSIAEFKEKYANGQSKFVFAYSDTPYEYGEFKVADFTHDLEIYGELSEDGEFPTLLMNTKPSSTVKKLHFERMHLCGAPGETVGASNYFVNVQDVGQDIESITFLNCKITEFERALYYDNNNGKLGSLVIKECEVNTIKQSFIDSRQKGSSEFGSLLIENSTIQNIGYAFLRFAAGVNPAITLKNNTIYNCGFASGHNLGFISVAEDIETFTMESNLILGIADVSGANKNQLFVTTKAKTMNKNFFYDCYKDFIGDEAAVTYATVGGAMLQTNPVVDAIGGLFNVTDASVKEAGAGDPRWLQAYVEVPEDLTQTVTSSVTTWDLEDAKIFRGKADKDMVRGNIRFYVQNTPFNLGGGKIEFTGKSVVDKAGIPTDAGMGIKVNQPGSIVVSTAASELAGKHSHLTVSLNGEISASVPVGAEYQKVTFPNITEESTVYITACDPIAISFLQWTDDIEVINNILDTPVLSIDKTSVQERDEETVTVSWEAVDYAGAYEVTFNEKKTVVTETSFEINTAALSVEEDGADFKVSVKAVPDSDDYIRVESQPAEVSFHVNDVPEEPGQVAGIAGVIKFDDYIGKASDGTLATEFEAGSIKLTVVADDAKKMAVDANNCTFGTTEATTAYTTRFKTGATSGAASALKLTVAAKGTIKIAVRTGSNNSAVRNLKVVKAGVEVLVCELDETKQKHTIDSGSYYDYFTTDVDAGEYDLTYDAGAVNIYAIEYIPASVAPAGVDYVWDFSAPEWVDAMTGSGIAANTNDSNWNLEVNGLKMIAGDASIKWNLSGETYFWQPGGAGSDSKRYFEFTTEMAGKLTVYASNTGSSEDLNRMVTVKVGDGAEESLPGGYSSSNGAVPVDFNITAGTVKIYPTGNGLRFYKIEFHSN